MLTDGRSVHHRKLASAIAPARAKATVGSVTAWLAGRYPPELAAYLRGHGRRVGRKRVARLMRGMGLSARRKRRFRRTTDSACAERAEPYNPVRWSGHHVSHKVRGRNHHAAGGRARTRAGNA